LCVLVVWITITRTMLGLNFKKNTELTDLPDKWTVLKSESDGSLMIVRMLENMESVSDKKDYPIRVGIAVPVASMDAETQKLLDSLEKVITDSFKTNTQGKLYAVITQLGSQTFKEYVVQSKSTADFALIHKDLKNTFPQLEIQMVAKEDPNWEMYQKIKAGKI
jgi:hypothetical protein